LYLSYGECWFGIFLSYVNLQSSFLQATELSAVKKYVDIVEQSLTKVSDELRNQDKLKIDSSAGVQEGSSIGTTPAAPQPMLRSFHRVGYFGEDLQLQGDRDVQLVLLCSPPPTLELVDRVAQTLSAHLKVRILKFCFNFEIAFNIIFFFL